MANSEKTFYVKYKGKELAVPAPHNRFPPDLFSVFKTLFPGPNGYPEDAFYFEMKHIEFPVKYRVDDPGDVYPGAKISVKIDKERIPLGVIPNEALTSFPGGPVIAEKTVKLKGLPWECGEEEIISFFEGLNVKKDGVTIVYNGPKIKRHTGEAFVEFEETDSVEKALEKDKQCIFGRYVEVIKTSKREIDNFKRREFEQIVNSNASIPVDEESIIIKLVGLPWEASFSEIRNLLIDVPLTAIHFPKDKLGRPNGVAFVEVADEEFSARTLGHHREYIGKRFIDIRKTTMAELLLEMNSTGNVEKVGNPESTTLCLLIQNLSKNSTNVSIENFFTQSWISPFRIHKKIDGTEAYCEFSRKNDFVKALGMSGSLIDGSPIRITKVTYNEVAQAVGIN